MQKLEAWFVDFFFVTMFFFGFLLAREHADGFLFLVSTSGTNRLSKVKISR